MTALAADFGPAFPPGLERFGQTLHAADPAAVPVTELLRPQPLAQAVELYSAGLGSVDHRAALSMWSQYYLLALVPAAVASCLVPGAPVPLDAAGMGAQLTPQGLPHAFCVSACTAGEPSLGRATTLLRRHLGPVACGLAAAGLPQRVFWCNAAAKLAWTLQVVAAAPGTLAPLCQALAARDWCDGEANPLHGLLDGEGRLCRRVCCLRYRLPGFTACGSCPRGVRPARN